MTGLGVNNLHIIIVEDDLDDGEFMLKSFTKHPAFSKVQWAKNGKALLDMLGGDDKNPDLILTDINMPVIDGIETIKALSQDPGLNTIPVFACSSTVNPAYKKKCMALGTRAFLAKPFDLYEYDLFPNKIISALGKV